jgi:hypothetical protein
MIEKKLPTEINNINDIGPNDRPGEIVLLDKAPHITVLLLCTQNSVKHVVQKSNINSPGELEVSSLMVNSPNIFFQFPLCCILGSSVASAENENKLTGISFLVEKLSERENILSSFEMFVKNLTASPALLNDVLTVVDEAFTNAVYNAPFVGNNATRPPLNTHDLEIDADKKPLIFAGNDSERVVVGCRDAYGSLNVAKLINRIKACYETNVSDMINFGAGGAGIGSFLMFNSCASMYIGVDSDCSTTICCSFPYKLAASRRSEMPKNIHLIHR